MSALGQIAKGIGEAGEGVLGAQAQAAEYRRKLQEQEDAKRLYYEQIAQKARDQALETKKRDLQTQYSGPGKPGIRNGVLGTLLFNTFTHQYDFFPNPAGFMDEPKPSKPVIPPDVKGRNAGIEAVARAESVLRHPLSPKEREVVAKTLLQQSFSVMPGSEGNAVLFNSRTGGIQPAPPGVVPKGKEGQQAVFDSMPDGPAKWSFGHKNEVGGMEKVNQKMLVDARDLEAANDAFDKISAIYNRVVAAVPPEHRNDPVDVILNGIKKGVYRWGISPGRDLDTLISLTERNKFAALRAITPQIRNGELIQKVIRHMPVVGQSWDTFGDRLNAVQGDIQSRLERTLQDSHILPQEWAMMKKTKFGYMPGGGPSRTEIPGAASGYSSIVDLKKAVASGSITPAQARDIARSNGWAK